MPNLYSIGGNLVSKEEYDKFHGKTVTVDSAKTTVIEVSAKPKTVSKEKTKTKK